ncbi:MAG: hypothetical protein ACON42_03400, partial [Flavobacteriaceae bacterium]
LDSAIDGMITSSSDSQTIDQFAIVGDDLTLSLENDGEAALTVPLSDIAGKQTGTGDPNTNGVSGDAGDIYVNDATGDIYTHNGTTWVAQEGTDNQNAAQVDTTFDADGDSSTQDTVEDAITALDTAIDNAVASSSDSQTIDQFAIVGDDLTLSLENDGQAALTVPLSDIAGKQTGAGNPNTNGVSGNAGDIYIDETTGDIYTHNGTTWVAQDGSDDQTAAEVSFDDSTAGTGATDVQGALEALDTAIDNAAASSSDSQTIDIFQVTGDNLELSLENDGQATQSISLATIDNQDASEVSFDDSSAGTGATDVQGALEALDTAINNAAASSSDSQTIDIFQVNGDNLELSLENDGQATQSISLATIDNQEATEVNLTTPTDFDDDSTNENTVEEALLALQTVVNETEAAQWILSAEYAGGAMHGDGSDNSLTMTSDVVTAGSSSRWMTYYQASNFNTDSGTNDYDIAVRIMVPADFDSWQTTALSLAYTGTADAQVQYWVYPDNNATALSTASLTGPGGSGDNFTTGNIASGAQMASLGAGDQFTILIRLTVTDVGTQDASFIRIGDISLNYIRQK